MTQRSVVSLFVLPLAASVCCIACGEDTPNPDGQISGVAGMTSTVAGSGGMGMTSNTAGMSAVAGAATTMGGAGTTTAGASSGGAMTAMAGATAMAGMGAGGMMANAGGMSAGGMGMGGGNGLPAGCEMLGSPGSTGIQCDPGTDGNGSFEHQNPANPVPDIAQDDPRGMLTQQQTFQSTIYGYGFNYRIYVPDQYEAGKPAALMIFQDGGLYTGEMNGPSIMDDLIDAGEMPVTISAYIEPTGQRSVEYDTRSDKYPRMIVEEFIPEAIAANYDIVDDPNGWAIGGHSSGGCCAFNVAWFFPDSIRKVVTNNGSFTNLQDPGMDEYPALIGMESKPIRVTLSSGTMDLGGDRWFNANNDMADALEAAGYDYRYIHSTSSHNLTPFSTADFPDVLRWLWRGYTLPHYEQ